MTQTATHSVATPPAGFEEAPCPKCHGVDRRVVFRGRDHLHGLPGEFSAVECAGCGFWFLSPRPTRAALEGLYPSDYAPHAPKSPPAISNAMADYLARELGYEHLRNNAHSSGIRGRLADIRMRRKVGINLIPRFVPGGSLLEIGAASGLRLAGLRQLGWSDLHGIELVPAAAERARAQGLAVKCGAVEETLETYPDRSFDVIVTSMVLEHLTDPFAVIDAAARKLKPRGQLMFSTITRDSLDARLYGAYWGGFDFPRHLVFMRDTDIDAMVKPWFHIHERFHHAAPQDFLRSSAWREHEERWIDRAVLSLRSPATKERIGRLLAWLGLTCRVSYRCEKRA